jgi:hypothetical protein
MLVAEQVPSAIRSYAAPPHQHVDELVEDDTVGDAWPVAPQGMGVDMFGQQSGELVPQRSMTEAAGQAQAPRGEETSLDNP